MRNWGVRSGSGSGLGGCSRGVRQMCIRDSLSLGQAVDVVVGRAQVGGVLEHHLVGAELLHLAALDQIAGDAHQVGVRGIEAHVVYPKGEGPLHHVQQGGGVLLHIGGDGEDVPHPRGEIGVEPGAVAQVVGKGLLSLIHIWSRISWAYWKEWTKMPVASGWVVVGSSRASWVPLNRGSYRGSARTAS